MRARDPKANTYRDCFRFRFIVSPTLKCQACWTEAWTLLGVEVLSTVKSRWQIELPRVFPLWHTSALQERLAAVDSILRCDPTLRATFAESPAAPRRRS